jgi:hypothetical protein
MKAAVTNSLRLRFSLNSSNFVPKRATCTSTWQRIITNCIEEALETALDALFRSKLLQFPPFNGFTRLWIFIPNTKNANLSRVGRRPLVNILKEVPCFENVHRHCVGLEQMCGRLCHSRYSSGDRARVVFCLPMRTSLNLSLKYCGKSPSKFMMIMTMKVRSHVVLSLVAYFWTLYRNHPMKTWIFD